MVKDHSDSERGNPLPPHGLLFKTSSKGSFICIIPKYEKNNRYHSLCYTSRGALVKFLEDRKSVASVHLPTDPLKKIFWIQKDMRIQLF